jgi:hypothetical protein
MVAGYAIQQKTRFRIFAVVVRVWVPSSPSQKKQPPEGSETVDTVAIKAITIRSKSRKFFKTWKLKYHFMYPAHIEISFASMTFQKQRHSLSYSRILGRDLQRLIRTRNEKRKVSDLAPHMRDDNGLKLTSKLIHRDIKLPKLWSCLLTSFQRSGTRRYRTKTTEANNHITVCPQNS